MAIPIDPAAPQIQRVLPLLHRLPYFAELPPPTLNQLVQAAHARSFETGAIIFGAGEHSAGLWLIEAGGVKIFKLNLEGREHVLHLLGPGDTFNDIAALDGGSNPAHAAATSAVQAWLIPTAAIQMTLRTHPALAVAVVQSLAQRVRQLVLQIEDLALRSVTARLARYILEQAENPTPSAPGVTRALIATHLATTPETVSRSLRALEQAGAIRFDRHRIVVEKAELLRDLAMI